MRAMTPMANNGLAHDQFSKNDPMAKTATNTIRPTSMGSSIQHSVKEYHHETQVRTGITFLHSSGMGGE